ncbi:hypothetical protein D9Q98_004705 [Chlorella vulgaris]|uniref:UspA domain-containing protein n=1 Tax=Chlorella vulgaris TaxID=3077 RepID=A0A9D4YXP7_CHLVU|nr:hypothetical protein D9Q98_004705 [Chlorella vulgaris]
MCVIAVNITSTQCKQRSGLLAQPLIRSVAPVTFGRPAHNGSRLGASLNRRRRTPFGFTAVFAKAQQESAAQAAESKGRNILVAADSSEDSRWALKWVAQELYRPGDLVHVAHCIPSQPLVGGLYSAPDGGLAMVDVDHLLVSEEQYMLAEQQQLGRACAEAFENQQVAYVVQVLREAPPGSSSRDKGRVAEALCRKAADLKAAALVVASQRKGALSEWVLGSVAADCVSHSTRPVLVLHAPLAPLPERPGLLTRLTSVLRGGSKGQHAAEVAAEPTGAASTGEQQQGQERLAQKQQVQQGQQQQRAGSRTILLAVDDSDASEAACVWALRNLHRPGTAFHLLRIIPTLPAGAAFNNPVMDGVVVFNEPPAELFKGAAQHYMQHRFEPKLQEAGVPYHVDIVLEPVDNSVAGVGEAICSQAADLQAAAVVMGSHMRGGVLQFILGSVSQYVAHRCTRPVAVLH